MLISRSEFMSGYVFRGGDVTEFVPSSLTGELPAGKIDSLSVKDKQKIKDALDFSLMFHGIEEVDTVSQVEGHFGILTVGPYLDKDTALAKLATIKLDAGFDGDSLEDLLEDEDYDESEISEIVEFDDEDDDDGYINKNFDSELADEDDEYESSLDDDASEDEI